MGELSARALSIGVYQPDQDGLDDDKEPPVGS